MTNSNSSALQSGASKSKMQHELENQFLGIDRSLKQDPSQANVVTQFVNVIKLEGTNKMDGVLQIVIGMGEAWRNFMKDESELTKVVGYSEMNKLNHIRSNYYLLLPRTKNVIVGLLKQIKKLKRHVKNALYVVQKAKNNTGSLDKGDRAIYEQSIDKLVRWIDQSPLAVIFRDWGVLCTQLEVQKKSLATIAKAEERKRNKQNQNKAIEERKRKKRNRNIAILSHLLTFLTAPLMIVAPFLGPLFIPLMMVPGLFFSSLDFSICLSFECNVKPALMRQKMNQISSIIQKSRAAEKCVADIQAAETKIEKRARKRQSFVKIERCLKMINKHLDEYNAKANRLLAAIEN